MGIQRSPIQTMTALDAERKFREVIHRVSSDTRIVVEESGQAIAAIVSVDDLRRLNQLDAQLAERHDVVEAMRAPFRGVPSDEIEREAQRAVAAVREENRLRRAKVTAPR